jgi:hypothetical protein
MPYKDPDKRKAMHKKASAEHYQRNLAAIKARTATNNRRKRKEFQAYKATLSCIQCGENHPATLDFHHHTPKPTNRKINELLKERAWQRIYREIEENCIVLCSNCHRKHHWEENKNGRAQI